MKIVFSTTWNPHFLTITEYVERAGGRLGQKFVGFDDSRFLIPGRLRDRVPVLARLDLAYLNRRLALKVERTRPDVLLSAGGERIHPATVEAARRAGATTVLWTIDPLKPEDPRLALAPHFDFVFCGGTEMMQALQAAPLRRPAVWLPFGCDPELHRPVSLSPEEQRTYGHDVAFVGSLHAHMYPNRIEMLEALADRDLGVWGPGAHAIPPGSPIAAHVRGEGTGYELWTRIYSASKIVLCAHYAGPGPRSRQASPRVYEALACGAFLLCDDRPDVTALFGDGCELAVFGDRDELRDKARHYLSHEKQRERIAQQGRRAVLAQHTYTHRLQRMLDVIGRG